MIVPPTEWLSSEVQQLDSAWFNCALFRWFTPSSDNTREDRDRLASTELALVFGGVAVSV